MEKAKKAWHEDTLNRVIIVCLALVIVIGLINNDGKKHDGPPTQHWDHSIDCVETYVKSHLNDPGSYESVKWEGLEKINDSTYSIFFTYRAKNGFGGMVTETKEFFIRDNEVINVQ